MPALATVSDYVALARTLLQDTASDSYRYPDADLVMALNLAFMEAKKLRPDLFINTTLPFFTVNDTTPVTMDDMYKVPLVYYMCGNAQLRDDEPVTDQRAAAFLGLFTTKLLGTT